MAGCENTNLKQQYLCENHFKSIYLSRTPRRTVLLPNAVPYRWDENGIGDDNNDGEYNDGKQMVADRSANDEILLEPLIDDEAIYADNDRRHHQSIEILDDDAVDDGDEDLIAAPPTAAPPKAKHIKIREPVGLAKYTSKDTIIIQQRMSLPNAGGLLDHVTKRQKINNQSSNDQPQRKVRMMDSKKVIRLDEKLGLNNGKGPSSGNSDYIMFNPCDAMDSAETADTDMQVDNTSNHPDIATFILKGDEYVQMPKRLYLEQRAEHAQLVAELSRYRKYIDKIKSAVNSMD